MSGQDYKAVVQSMLDVWNRGGFHAIEEMLAAPELVNDPPPLPGLAPTAPECSR